MWLLPALCLLCRQVQLIKAQSAGEQDTTCRCGGELRVVPGCSFALHDRELFRVLSEIASEATLHVHEAQRMALEVERALWSGAYKPLLDRLCARMPGLIPIEVAAGRNSAAQRRALGMLKIILEALARPATHVRPTARSAG